MHDQKLYARDVWQVREWKSRNLDHHGVQSVIPLPEPLPTLDACEEHRIHKLAEIA